MNKRRYIILVIAIVTFGMCLVGGTYAYLAFSNVTLLGNASGEASCFLVDYDYTNDDGSTELSGTLFQTSVPKTGVSGKVSMAINDECNMCSLGSIHLRVNNTTSSVLYKKVNKAHCEDPRTLKTITEYNTSSACTTAGYSWVNNVSALKYAVYNDSSDAPLSVGYIDGVKDITLYSGFSLSSSEKEFDIYVWLDGELADNSYLGVSFDGDIHLGAEQTEDECKFTVSYDANGGSNAPEAEFDYSGVITLSNVVPTRSGYTFKGWATTAEATTKEYDAGEAFNLLSDVTLYAVWESAVVTINANRYVCEEDNRLGVYYVTQCTGDDCTCSVKNGLAVTNGNYFTQDVSGVPSGIINTLQSTVYSNISSLTSITNVNGGHTCSRNSYCINATGGLNCRTAAHTSAILTTNLANGKRVNVWRTTIRYNSTADWYYYPDSDCFLSGAYLSTNCSSAPQPVIKGHCLCYQNEFNPYVDSCSTNNLKSDADCENFCSLTYDTYMDVDSYADGYTRCREE